MIRVASRWAPDATRRRVNGALSGVMMGYASVRSVPTKSDEIRPMTGVRGIAALSVVALHFFNNADAAVRPWQHAYLAVDLFFMLSGLVLALTHSSTVTLGAGREPYIAFIKKRIARIYPLYIAVTLLETFFDVTRHFARGLPMPVTWEPKGMIANLFLVQTWGISGSVVLPAWSLSTEMGAYLLFPVLVALTIRSKPAMAWGAAASSVMLLLAASLGSRGCGADCNGFIDVTTGTTLYPLMRCVAGFTFGLIGYRLVREARIRSMVSTNLFAILSVVATVAAYCVGSHDLVVYVLLFATVLACFGNSRAANFMFGNRLVFFLGKISFSIYLVHMLLYPAVRRVEAFSNAHFGRLSGVFSVLAIFLAVLVLAAASYYLIEVPGKGFMMALMSRKKRGNAAHPSAVGERTDAL
jgi:peptidoglycan/LPS O-acetylase OafA/YrhL